MLVASLLLGLALPAPLPASDIVVIGQRQPASLTADRVPDARLAEMRGGVNLPNGLMAAIGIDIQTRLDGVLILHTVYSSDGPNAGVRVFTDGTDAANKAPGTLTVTTAASGGAPSVTVDRSPGGTLIVPGQSTAGTTVNLVNGGPTTWLSGEGQTPIPVTPNGPAVAAAPGNVRLQVDPSGVAVILDAPSLQVRQLIGRATGAVIANTGNDRSIETVSSVNVDLQGLSPAVLAGIFAAQRVAIDAMLAR